ncbi:MAG: ester cyclase [Acidobacteriota bacterium]
MNLESQPSASSPTSPIELARQMVDQVWNRGEEASSLMPHSFHWAEDSLVGPTRVSGMGGRSMLQEARANRRAFEDFEIKVTDAFEDDAGRALLLWVARGTHDQEAQLGNNRLADGATLQPSGRSFSATGWFLVQTRDGLITGVSPSWNPMTLLQQLAVAELDVPVEEFLG